MSNQSELLALAERIDGDLGPFSFVTRGERSVIVSALRAASAPAEVPLKKTYIKPLRTIVEIDARYADQIRDLLNAASAPAGDGGERATAADIARVLQPRLFGIGAVGPATTAERNRLIADGERLLKTFTVYARPPAVEVREEDTAWLIEFSESVSRVPAFYGQCDEGLGQTTDHAKAIRFTRAQDAQTVIDDIGWTEARPVEHMWPTPRALSASPREMVQEDPTDKMIDAALAVDWECDGDTRAVAVNVWHAMNAARHTMPSEGPLSKSGGAV